MTPTENRQYDRQVASWLLFCAAVLLGMILLGGVTRLTNSGLSIVEWKPLLGAIPPCRIRRGRKPSTSIASFRNTRRSIGDEPGRLQVHFHVQYLHPPAGPPDRRAVLLPLLYFAWRGRIRQGLMPKLVVLFFLGGCQGLLGWFMVKSGLVDNPRVSQYRLTAHLGLAVAIYAYMLWLAFDLLFRPAATMISAAPRDRTDAPRGAGGAGLPDDFVRRTGGGHPRGFAYSTWPLMGDSFIPRGCTPAPGLAGHV